MEFDLNAYGVGVILGVLVSLDSVIVSIFGYLLGFEIQKVGIFFVPAVKRKIAGRTWAVGWLPFGSYVKFKGLNKEEGEAVDPGDFGQQPLGRRILLLMVDKIFFGTLVLLALLMISPDQLGAGFDLVWGKFAYIFQISSQPPAALTASVGLFPYLLASVSLWTFLSALLPFGGNKTQILLLELLGNRKLAQNQVIAISSMLLGLAFMGFVIYCIIRYVNIAYEGEVWSIWASLLVGALTVSIFWILLFLAIGKPVANKPV